MMYKSQRMMILMIKSKLVLQSSIRINKSYILMLVRMIGNFNAKEWPTSLKYNRKMIINNGGPESNPLELPLTLLRKSICIFM